MHTTPRHDGGELGFLGRHRGRRPAFLVLVITLCLGGPAAARALMPPAVRAVDVYRGDEGTTAAVLIRGNTLGALGGDRLAVVDRTTGRSVRFFLDRFCRAVGPGVGRDNAPPGSVQQSCRLWLSLRNLNPGHTYALRMDLGGSAPLFLPLENGRALREGEGPPTSGAEGPLRPVEQDGLWGYEDGAGGVRIPARFVAALPFNPYGLAAVLDPDKGWQYVDRQGKEVIRPHVLDNGPDPFVEGLARFWRGDKMGFFDPRGRVVIEPAWEFARPFSEGRSAVCRGCRLVPDGEYTAVRGGRWGVVDPFGREVVPIRFERVGDYEDGRVWVEDQGRRRVLDRQGKGTAPSASGGGE